MQAEKDKQAGESNEAAKEEDKKEWRNSDKLK